jgi:chaperonin GroES
MKLRPLGDRVVVQPVEREMTTPSGIVLPDTAKEKPQEGKVLAVGPGRLLEDGNHAPLDIKEGDRIIYSKYSGTEFAQDGLELLVLSERDVLAVID